jgi:hypothetical protein
MENLQDHAQVRTGTHPLITLLMCVVAVAALIVCGASVSHQRSQARMLEAEAVVAQAR